MDFDIKKHLFTIILGGCGVLYVAIYFLLIFPMSAGTEKSVNEAKSYVDKLEDAQKKMGKDTELPVKERIDGNLVYQRALLEELEKSILFYTKRDESIEVPFGYPDLDTAIERYEQSEGDPSKIDQVKNTMKLFFGTHFDLVKTAIVGPDEPARDAARAKVFVPGPMNLDLYQKQKNPWGTSKDVPIKEYIVGLMEEATGPDSLLSMDDIRVLRKEFILTKAFLEILNKVLSKERSESLARFEILAKHGEGQGQVGLTQDLLRNPYLEGKGGRPDDPATWKYSPAFLARIQVMIRYENATKLVAALLDGKAQVKLGGEDPHEVQLTTMIKSVRLVKELGDPTAETDISIRAEDLPSEPEKRQARIDELKREKVADLTQPITMYVDVYALDFVSSQRAKELLEGKPKGK
ncbi:MAG: hypothetical protein HY720_24825 [Planctomycetes bacterium]|nr:hypothetical protein [Planctomycetota bacterium]